MNEELIQIIKSLQTQTNDQLKKVEELSLEIKKLTESSLVPPHQHKVDRVNFQDLVGGVKRSASVPTEPAEEGTFRMYGNVLYMKSNQSWVVVGGTTYAGYVASGGSGTLPSGWSSSNTGTGAYTITHSLGTTSYSPVAMVVGTNQVMVINAVQTNDFSVVIQDRTTGNLQNANFYFILIPF